MCSTYAWRSNGIPFSSREGHMTVARPRSIRALGGQNGGFRPRGARCSGCELGELGELGKGCKRQTRAGEPQTAQPDSIIRAKSYDSELPAIDPLRNARTRVFAAVIQSDAVTSNQISRALRRSQVS
jgi:hypothetical protein